MTTLIKAGTLLGAMMILVFHPNQIGQEGENGRAPKDDNQRVIKSENLKASLNENSLKATVRL